MRILAIDPGIEKVGYAIFDKGKNRDFIFIISDLITTPRNDKQEQRLRLIYQTLCALIQTYNINQMVIEKLFYFKNKKTVIDVAQAIGVIELAAAQCDVPIARLTPLEIKQTVTGYGNADKQSVQKMIRLELGDKIIFKDDDESDAIACGLAYCFRNLIGPEL